MDGWTVEWVERAIRWQEDVKLEVCFQFSAFIIQWNEEQSISASD